uniref:Uncharacterized protein n=1 Tax=Molossus molossus TaxID=27622 RepID=A0A7J8JXE2_MOLMO|nr:hypothetical protein HJG59_008136 [Molossus molossus]
MGLLHSLRLMMSGGMCFTQEIWCLQCVKMVQPRDPGGCPFISLPRATHPRPSLCNSSPLALAALEPKVFPWGGGGVAFTTPGFSSSAATRDMLPGHGVGLPSWPSAVCVSAHSSPRNSETILSPAPMLDLLNKGRTSEP